ncbi:MAG: hypothetical protein U0350_18295 [Caldilineaceae bacterium]
MPTAKESILEAHVQYELKRWRGKNLKPTLQGEVASLLSWFEQVQVRDVLKATQLLQSMRRTVVELPLSTELSALIKENVVVVYEFLQQDKTKVKEILPRKLFDEMIKNIIRLEELRHEVTHQVIFSSVYSMLVSNVLYQGIKGFVLTENAFVKNIPGASSFVRLGQKALNAAAPKLEKGIDKQLVTFINGNIQETIYESETFLNNTLDAALITKLSDEVWAANSETEMAKLTGYVDADSLEVMVELVQNFWLHYRNTPLFYNLVRAVLHKFFARHGKKNLRTFLAEMGITSEIILQETYQFAIPFVEQALESGYLEKHIRTRLDAFYTEYYAQQA